MNLRKDHYRVTKYVAPRSSAPRRATVMSTVCKREWPTPETGGDPPTR